MKVLILANTHFPLMEKGLYQGGIETIVGETFKLLNKFGIEAHIALTKDATFEGFTEEDKRIFYHEGNSTLYRRQTEPDKKRFVFNIDYGAIKNYCETNGITHLFCNIPNQKVAAPLEQLGLPTLHLLHQCIGEFFDFHNYKKMFEKYSSWTTAGNKIVAVSNFVKENVKTKLQTDQVEGVLNPTIYPEVDFNPDKLDEFLFITRVQRNYRIKEVLEVLFRTKRGVTIAGFNNDNEYLLEIEELAKSYGVNFNYLGLLPREDLIKTASKYKYYLAQVNNEAFGMSVLEAASTGAAVVAIGDAERTGIVDFIAHANHIFIEEIRDKNQMASQLRDFLSSDDFDGYLTTPRDQHHYFNTRINSENYVNTLKSLLLSIAVK